MTNFELRPYQNTLLDRVRLEMQAGARSIIAQMPTGAGKTACAIKMLGTSAERGMRSLFIVHRRELIRQTIRAFADVGIQHGVVNAGYMEDRRHLIQAASIQTYTRRLARFEKPALVVWDECHHIAAGSWAAVYDAFPGAYHIGLTATPKRLDGTGLGRWFKSMVNGPSVSWLIEHGYLSSYRLFSAPEMISVAGVKSKMGDYDKAQLSAAADRPRITGNAVSEYQRHCSGKRALAFCVTIEHSKHVASEFNAAGIPAAHVDGETPKEQRDEAIERFERGDILVLCNVDLFGEGVDIPAVEAVIILRPSESEALYLQWIGRSLRPSPGKEYAVILDHAGNYLRHGLPDQDREWSLEDRKKNNSDDDATVRAPVKTCDWCSAVSPAACSKCKVCGFDFETNSGGQQIEYVAGNLVEVDVTRKLPPAAKTDYMEQGRAESLEALTELGRRRGYKQPYEWAKFVFDARERRKREGKSGA